MMDDKPKRDIKLFIVKDGKWTEVRSHTISDEGVKFKDFIKQIRPYLKIDLRNKCNG